jgi:hypothetical protein
MCRLIERKTSPPSAKRLIYNVCVKSKIRYSAGLAPWTTTQYQELDKTPAELLRQIYGLRRTFPSDLIYAPENLGGCGNLESVIPHNFKNGPISLLIVTQWRCVGRCSHLNAPAGTYEVDHGPAGLLLQPG